MDLYYRLYCGCLMLKWVMVIKYFDLVWFYLIVDLKEYVLNLIVVKLLLSKYIGFYSFVKGV